MFRDWILAIPFFAREVRAREIRAVERARDWQDARQAAWVDSVLAGLAGDRDAKKLLRKLLLGSAKTGYLAAAHEIGQRLGETDAKYISKLLKQRVHEMSGSAQTFVDFDRAPRNAVMQLRVQVPFNQYAINLSDVADEHDDLIGSQIFFTEGRDV